jgi:cytosine/adenosine deaminase-related metal-dependent hydrolase
MKIKGHIYWNDKVIEGTVEIDEGTIVDITPRKSRCAIEGVFLPYFVNMHTHLGDSFIAKEPLGSIMDIVGPDGMKARELALANKTSQKIEIRKNLKIMLKEHVSTFVDFREGGIEGIKLLKDTFSPKLNGLILSRPEKNDEFDPKETDMLLENSAGIGLSSISDYPQDIILKIRKKVLEKRKIFAIHASERIREDIDFILDLKPLFLVHMLKATDSDLERVKQEKVSIVVTPKSNSQFGYIPNISRLLKFGINVAIGTDNGMFTPPSIRSEMEYLYRISNVFTHIDPLEILKMSTINSLKILNQKPFEIGKKASGLFFNTTPYKIVSNPFLEPLTLY